VLYARVGGVDFYFAPQENKMKVNGQQIIVIPNERIQ
jgi:hypothetical protein